MNLVKYQINNFTISKFTRLFTKYIQDLNYSVGSDCKGNIVLILEDGEELIKALQAQGVKIAIF